MTLHGDAVQTLQAWEPPDAGQERLRVHFLEHLRAHGDAMWRECRPDHLTASALVVSPDRRKVLLTLHARIGRWLQMGGHCEPGDRDLAAAALREAREESGLDRLTLSVAPALLSRHEVPCGPVRPAHHLDVQYVATAPDNAVPVISAESEDLCWFDVDDLPGVVDDSVRALVRHGVPMAPQPG
jgi:8-oxo-dGTP pyrophosphatase MutT (NUDIX family)